MEEKERYDVKRLSYSLNVKLTDNYEPDWRYIIFDDVNDAELDKLETVCNLLNQQDKRIKELEQENQQLKQQLHDLPKKIVEEIEEEIIKYDLLKNFPNEAGYCMFNSILDTILEKYGGEDDL